MTTGLLVIAILILLIVVHELGHFVAAKLFGVKVQEFGIGYPPRALTFGRWGGTEYTLNWLPFGGFVRLFGESPEGEHGKGSLLDAPRSKQAVILLAGVGMNALFGWFLFASALHLGVPRAVDPAYAGEHAILMVSSVVPSSPADAAGLEPGDEITGIRDEKGTALASLTPERMVDFVSARGGKELELSFRHDGAERTAYLSPANAVVPGAEGRAGLGIVLALVTVEPMPLPEAAVAAWHQTVRGIGSVVGSLWSLVLSALDGAPDLTEVVGPVGIVGYVGAAAQNGFGSVLLLAGIISVNLVVINLIPIPALDGGRLLVLAIEALRRKRIPRLALQLSNALGISVIIMLMFVVTYHDVVRLLV